MKIAFFDFCDTLVDLQTANAFVKYVRLNNPTKWAFFINVVYFIFYKMKGWFFLNILFPKSSLDKKFYLFQLRGIDFATLDKLAKDYYELEIKPRLIPDVIKELNLRRDNNFLLVIVSGGFDIYLKYFCQEFCVNTLICTELNFNNSVFTGRMLGADCMFDEKTVRIKEYFHFDLSESVAYSDSITDLPMLKMMGESFVISKHQSQDWVNKYGFKEFILN